MFRFDIVVGDHRSDRSEIDRLTGVRLTALQSINGFGAVVSENGISGHLPEVWFGEEVISALCRVAGKRATFELKEGELEKFACHRGKSCSVIPAVT